MNNKLNTEEIKFMIPDYISGMLNDTDKALVSEAIKESEEVREFYNEMKGTFDFVSSVKFKEPEPEYWNSLLPRIHEKIDSRETEASGFSWDKIAAMWKILVPIAAVILIAVIYYLVQPSNTQLTEEKKTEEIKKNDLIKNDSSKDENNIKENIKQEKVTEDKNNDNIVKEQNDGNKTRNNSIKRNYTKPDNATAKNIIPEIENIKESQEPVKDEQLALDIEETSMFADGEGAGFDEETEDDLKKLNDNEKEVLLQELQNSNL
jgi:hypothetical protein